MLDDSIFGHSLKMKDGDLVLQDLKLAEVFGQENLLQALKLRVLTPFGSDIFNTSYGLDISAAFTEPNSVDIVKQLIKLNLVRTLGADARVHDIRDILFEDDAEYQARHPEVSPQEIVGDRRRRTWKVEVIIQTADNQTQSLATSIGV